MKVYGITDGGPVVRGTDDPAEAREALRLWLLDAEEWYIEEERDGAHDVEAWARQRSAEWAVARLGWFRFNPCHPTNCWDMGGHAWHLGYARGPGRGNWKGVLFA